MFTTKARLSALSTVALVLMLFLAGCSADGTRAVLDLVPLQRALAAEYDEAKINVDLQNGHRLAVTVSGDASGEPAYERGADGAREVAEFVCQHYQSMDQIDRLRVAFAVQEGGVLADAKISAAYSWQNDELPCVSDG